MAGTQVLGGKGSHMANILGPTTETGGVESRRGLGYQDHAAVRLFLEALQDSSAQEICLEVRDDVVIVRSDGPDSSREYIQVKASTSDTLWSISKICERKRHEVTGGQGTSMVEKSLSGDDLESDPCPMFRFITYRNCTNELAPLKLARRHPGRTKVKIDPMSEAIEGKLGECQSPAGRNIRHWCENMFWEVYTDQALQDRNMLSLHQVADGRGYTLTPIQLKCAYEGLVNRLSTVAAMREETDRILSTVHIIENIERALSEALPHLGDQANNKLRIKLEAANVPEPLIKSAEDRRRAYSTEIYRPKYSTASRDPVFAELNARLSLLFVKFISEEDPMMTGQQFHIECMREVERYCDSLPDDQHLPLDLALGSMYETTNRCAHRFTREEPE
jgi:hypothetical protein